MHIYFSGIGGAGIGPLALVASQAGYEVSGSDKQQSNYISYLADQGISNVFIDQSYKNIANVHSTKPIDWFVYTSALTMENPDAPELQFCRDNNIKYSKRDEFLNKLLVDKDQKLIAIAGTHGKTTTTAMMVWVMQQLGQAISYILPAKTSYAQMGKFDSSSQYFIYEADEFDRNFLSYSPHLSLITGIDWDHPDIYPTKESYNQAFVDFISQSNDTVIWDQDLKRLNMAASEFKQVLAEDDPEINRLISLAGHVNRQDAWQVINAVHGLLGTDLGKLIDIVNEFPGLSRRFEQIVTGVYSDYAHTPPKIRGALQLGHETAGDNLVVIYEGLHNTRQHFIKDDLKTLFHDIKQLYVVPSYLAREDKNLDLWSPTDIIKNMDETTQKYALPSELNTGLKDTINTHVSNGDTVLCLTAGGGGSLDEWLRTTFI